MISFKFSPEYVIKISYQIIFYNYIMPKLYIPYIFLTEIPYCA